MEECLERLENEMQLVRSSSNLATLQHVGSALVKKPSTTHGPLDSSALVRTTHSTIRTLPLTGGTQHDNADRTSPSWFVTLQRTEKGLQLDSTINSMVDLMQFLTQGVGSCFSNSPQRPPNYYSNNSQQTMMMVTNKMLQVEYMLRQVFGKLAVQQDDTNNNNNHNILYSYNNHIRQMAILHLVDSHFHCVRSVVPIVASYYLPLISNQPESTVAYAMAGFMALSSCVIHVNDRAIPYDSRSEFGQYLYERTKEKLWDDLFDDTSPSIETVMAMLIMIRSSMILVRNKDTRLYLDLAWRTVLALRDRYLPTLQKYHDDPSATTTSELAQAETWRRVFYGVRYMLIHVQIIQDDPVDFTSLVLESDIGYPQPLECELNDPQEKRKVEIYSLSVRFDDCHISSNVDTIGYRLFAGVLDKASLFQLSYMEHRLFSYWQGLPGEFRLTRSPMEYLDPLVINMCQDHHILRINQLYYSHWLTLQTRFMQTSSTADLQGTSLTRLDGGRALLIVSICGDAMTQIFQAFHQRETCMLDLHWLLIVTDALQLLTKTANDAVRIRAGQNLRICLPILMAQMQAKHDSPASSSSHLFKLPTTTSSLSSMSSPASSVSIVSSPSTLSFSSFDNNYSTTGTNSDGLDEVCDEELLDWDQHQHALPSPGDMDPSLVYYGEVKKNLKTYFVEPSIEELD
ncbi:hypothetical protein BC941DRAFT_429964 [Chlamydoabsidia padenii]|nr:hypothetical protein BC941DRAFT_429964 [Chlamydoabsidia padenii]